jgi:hypothetical protein
MYPLNQPSGTMTLEQLQKKTLQLIKRVHKHLSTPTHISGVTDAEFLENACYGLETRIKEDQVILADYAPGPSLDGFAKWLDKRHAEELQEYAESDCAKHWYAAKNLTYASDALRGYLASATSTERKDK